MIYIIYVELKAKFTVFYLCITYCIIVKILEYYPLLGQGESH